MTEQKKIPDLRFPEFNEEWEEYLLKDIAEFSKGKGIPKADLEDNGVVKCITYGELYTTYTELISTIKSRTNLDKSNLVLSKANDVIIPASGESHIDIATASCVLKDGIALGGDLNIIRGSNNGVFLAYYFNNKKRKDIARFAQGSSVIHLYSTQLKLLKLLLPKLSEQQKTASFLTTLDKRLQLLGQKKDRLKQYKKGVMQQIFSQAIRFRKDDGKEYPEWKKKKLGDFMIERNIKTPKSDKYPLMSFVAHRGVTPKGQRYNREFLVKDEDNKKYKQTEYGDFIYSSNNLETGSIGLNRYGSACISPVYSIFQIGELCNYQFISRYLVRKSFLNKMIRFRQGVVYGQWRIHESDFLKIEDKIPSLPEQEKIAEFLTVIDDKISLVEQQIEKTEAYKKGLLQQMFV